MNDRVRTAFVVGPVFLAVLLFGGPVLFAFLVAGLAAVGAGEFRRMAAPEASATEHLLVAAWGAVVVLGFLCRASQAPGLLLALGAFGYLGAWVCGPGPKPEVLRHWSGALGSWVLVAFFLGHAVWVRAHGVSPVVFVLAIVWAGDTAAYYTGRAWGRRPLAPSVSPKKTVEGAVGGLAAAVAVAGGLGMALPLPHGVSASLCIGLLLNPVAQMGDLIESLIKRCAGCKDSGTIFPGHGGVLDRVDAFLFVLPAYAGILSLLGP
jgi:phosphatidate cytidylyltransferase